MLPDLSQDCGCGASSWLQRRAGRRGLLGCAGLVAAAVAMPGEAEAAAEMFPPLLEDIKIQRVPGTSVYYTLGHYGVPDERNEGHTSNAGFVVTDDGVVVFDALGTPALGNALLQKIRSVTDKPVKYVVVSHYHADHIYGLQAFRDQTDAVIVAQEKALDYTAEGNLDDEAAGPRLEQRRQALAPWVNENTRIVMPGFAFKVAAEMRIGQHQLQMIYAGPAHSMSDMMMLVLPERVLFAGDIVQNGRVPFMSSGAVNTKNWLQALSSVGELQPQFIIPGHGKTSTSVNEAIGFTQTYIDFVRQKMGDAVANWLSFEEAYQGVDWKDYAHMPAFPESNRGGTKP